MAEFLVFQLYGPLAAWGDIAVGEHRPSQGQPSKSAITGLMAAALGVVREDDAAHLELARHYALGACIRAEGEWLRDYHTIQVPGGREDYATRRQALRRDPLRLNTVISRRDYRTDAFYQIAVWPAGRAAPYTFEDLYYALRRPRFSLCLGRKSCPAGLPLYPRMMAGVTLKQAFDEYPLEKAGPWLSQLDARGLVRYVWEQGGLEPDEIGMESSMQYPRRDRVLSRRRWQFTDRMEHYHAEPLPGDS